MIDRERNAFIALKFTWETHANLVEYRGSEKILVAVFRDSASFSRLLAILGRVQSW